MLIVKMLFLLTGKKLKEMSNIEQVLVEKNYVSKLVEKKSRHDVLL